MEDFTLKECNEHIYDALNDVTFAALKYLWADFRIWDDPSPADWPVTTT